MTQAPARPLLRSSAAELTLDRLGPSFGAEVIGLDLRHADRRAGARDPRGTRGPEGAVLPGPGPHRRRPGRRSAAGSARSLPATRWRPAPAVEQPEIYNIDSADPEFSFSDVWHTDVTFMERPPLGSILRAVRLPSYGGDTSWVDSQLAYESLSAPGAGAGRPADRGARRQPRVGRLPAPARRAPATSGTASRSPSSRPSSTRSCGCTPRAAARGCSSTPASPRTSSASPTPRAAAVLDLLYAHLTKPEHTVRHRWQVGDVGIWDNRSTSHYANRDYDEVRVMRRITLEGDRPVGPSTR